MDDDSVVDEDVNIRLLAPQEIGELNSWCTAEGWNIGLNSLETFYNAYPNGQFLAAEKDGEIVGHCACVELNETVAFVSLFIVKEGKRGRGIGTLLWNSILSYFHNYHIAVNADDGIVEFYMQHGMNFYSFEYVTYALYINRRLLSTIDSDDSFQIQPTETVPISEIIEYDTSIHGPCREDYVRGILEQSGTISYAALDDGHVCGYGCVRLAETGYRVDPLYAERPSIGKALFNKLLSEIPPDADLTVQVLLDNPAALKVIQAHPVKKLVSSSVRIYVEEEIKVPVDKIYGLSYFTLT